MLVVTLRAVMERRNSGKAFCRSKRRYTGLLVRYRVVSGWRRRGGGEMESAASTAFGGERCKAGNCCGLSTSAVLRYVGSKRE